MKADDLIMVSVDDHLVEPPDLFEGHIPEPSTRTRRRKVVDTATTAPTCGPSTARSSRTSG